MCFPPSVTLLGFLTGNKPESIKNDTYRVLWIRPLRTLGEWLILQISSCSNIAWESKEESTGNILENERFYTHYLEKYLEKRHQSPLLSHQGPEQEALFSQWTWPQSVLKLWRRHLGPEETKFSSSRGTRGRHLWADHACVSPDPETAGLRAPCWPWEHSAGNSYLIVQPWLGGPGESLKFSVRITQYHDLGHSNRNGAHCSVLR